MTDLIYRITYTRDHNANLGMKHCLEHGIESRLEDIEVFFSSRSQAEAFARSKRNRLGNTNVTIETL